jgi:ACS family hexuronate transporter-like MFS transporter
MAFIACMGVGFVFMNLPPILPSLKTIYGVNNARIAFLVTSLVLTHAGVQIPAGVITDRMGVKKILILSLTVIVISSLLCTINSSYFFVLTMRLLNGVGTGFVFCAGNKYAILFTPEKQRGTVQGIFGGSFSMGAVLPFFIMPGLMAIDWRLAYLVTSLFLIVPLGFMLIWGKEVKPDSTVRLAQFKFLFLSKIILVLGFLHGIFLGSVMTLGTWFSSFAVHSSHIPSLKVAGVWGALMMLVSGMARFMGGFFLRGLSARQIILYSSFLLLLSFLVLSQVDHFLSLIVFFFLAFYASSVTFGPIFLISSIASTLEFAGTGFGIVNFIANLGGLFFPILFGYFIDLTGAFKFPFFFMSVLVLLGILMTFSVKMKTA